MFVSKKILNEVINGGPFWVCVGYVLILPKKHAAE